MVKERQEKGIGKIDSRGEAALPSSPSAPTGSCTFPRAKLPHWVSRRIISTAGV